MMDGNVEQRAKSSKPRSFLRSLKRNMAGNVIAITAASVVPTVGLIGAGIDMSRMYMAKTRLQGACDAATLMARKVQGLNTWASTETAARAAADQAFNLNFPSGVYATTNLTKELTNSGPVINGTASVDVPMTLTKIIGAETRTISVECRAELTIPNTDVMFVLDTTGSMSWNAAGGSPTQSSPSRIDGLKVAVKCFYEALAKENITDITPAQCNETTDPVGGNYSHVQLRFGFVPYSVNVNVGKLLPLNYMSDTWTYQSRQGLTATQTATQPVLGQEGSLTQVGSPVVTGSSPSWTNLPPTRRVLSWTSYVESFAKINGIEYSINRYKRDSSNNAPSNQNDCDTKISPRPSNSTSGTTGSLVLVSQTNPVYPATSIVKTYTRTSTSAGTEYQYKYLDNNQGWDEGDGGYAVNMDTNSAWQVEGGWRLYQSGSWAWRDGYKAPKHCRLQYRTVGTTTVTTFQTITPITWQQVQAFDRWSYQPVTFDISNLKRNNEWNSDLTLPIGTNGTMATVAWDGCIEERQTVRINGTDATGQWNPIPAGALDMNIDDAPINGQSNTQWGPMLPSAVYLRSSGNSYTRNYIETKNDFPTVSNYSCPTESKLQQSWLPNDFKDYVNSITVGGNTYHDIGLIWGARLSSPQGIFSAINNTPGKTIERHMIFMTDGDTNTYEYDYSAYGIHWWNRLQTPDNIAPTGAMLDTNVDERAKAMCTAIKNKNITLWVIAYGSTIDNATKTRLQNCASPNRYFAATDTAALMTRFKSIASDISQLRLTN